MNLIPDVAADGVPVPREAMAEQILSELKRARRVIPLIEQGYRVGITCEPDGIVASATTLESELPSLTARLNVAEWWDSKELGADEWARQLAHALAGALRAAEKRAGGERGRGGPERSYPGRLRLRMPTLPGRGYQVS